MKKIYGFAALAAAMTLASCSNNDDLVNPGNEPVPGEVHKGYVTVSLATPAVNNTRASFVEGTKVGTVEESQVNDALLITFVDGAVHEVVPFTPKPWYNSDDPAIDKESSTNIIEVTVPTETTSDAEGNEITSDKKITEFITVLNVKEADLGVSQGDLLDAVRTKLADYSSTDNGIMMSTSAYKDGDNATYTTQINGKIFKDLADAAKAENLITVYVERGLARVDYRFATSEDPTPYKNNGSMEAGESLVINEGMGTAEKTLTAETLPITVTGVSIANVSDRATLVKNIDGFMGVEGATSWPSFASNFNANDADTYRSHWADVAPFRSSLTSTDAGNWLNNKSYTSITTAEEDIADSMDPAHQYIQENTSSQNTCLLLTAFIGDGETTYYRFIANGKYYTGDDNVKTAALGYLEVDGYYKKVENGTDSEGNPKYKYVSLAKEDLDIKAAYNSETGLNGYDGYIQFADALKGKLVYTTDKKEFKDIEDADWADENAKLVAATCKSERENITLKKYRVYKWNNGKCYYFLPLQPSEVGVAGVVRNHIYDLKITGVAGLGVPVFNSNEIIIPEIPNKVDPKEPENYYIRATINILNWTYYSQDMNFVTPEGD